MWNVIFQISEKPISKEEWLDEEQVMLNIQESMGTTAVDCVEALCDCERVDAISQLVDANFPAGMFRNNGDDSIKYVGGFEKWVKEVYIPKIKAAANAIDPERIFKLGEGSSSDVLKAINNPLEFSTIFIPSEPDYFLWAVESGNFMENVVSHLKPGDNLYIGAAFCYHY